MRLDVRRAGHVKVSDQPIGSRTRVKVAKNKCAPPFRMAEFEIRWGTGIDAAAELLDRAVDLGVIDKSGAHLSFGGERIGQGRERARQAILDGTELEGALRGAIEQATAPGGVIAQA